jgi:hypothetical protein
MEERKRESEPRAGGAPVEVQERISEGIRAVEAARAAGLAQAAALQEAKAATLRREVARMRAKHGRGSAEEQLTVARLAAHERLQSELSLERSLATRPDPRPEKGAFVLEGHVLDEKLDPIEGAIASAVLEDGDHIAEDSTDSRGRFRLEVPAPKAARDGEPPAVRLEVALERDEAPVHRDDFPQAATPGNVGYRRVVLPRGREKDQPTAS